MKYDYLIVGSGLFGVCFARTMAENGRRCLILEKRSHVGGNVHTEKIEGIWTHIYGPHIFHTSNEKIWNFVNRFTSFLPYQHKVLASYEGKLYSMPFNMLTYYQLWGCTTPVEARKCLDAQRVKIENPRNLEEYALATVGVDLYDKLIYGYTKKQWNRSPKDLPKEILKRIPCRMNFNDRYYHDHYEGIPQLGYDGMIESMLDYPGIDVKLNSIFDKNLRWDSIADKLVFSGSIDELLDYKYGPLEYRSLKFEHKIMNGDFQGLAQMNFTHEDIPYSRIVEHKHFMQRDTDASTKTVITYEYPMEWEPGLPRFYPINDTVNNDRYKKYQSELQADGRIIVGGRLGTFRYLDMHQVIAHSLNAAQRELKEI